MRARVTLQMFTPGDFMSGLNLEYFAMDGGERRGLTHQEREKVDSIVSRLHLSVRRGLDTNKSFVIAHSAQPGKHCLLEFDSPSTGPQPTKVKVSFFSAHQ